MKSHRRIWRPNRSAAKPDWVWNNPETAAREFVSRFPEFVVEEPVFPFNEGLVDQRVTYWPSAYLKRIKPKLSK